METTNIETRLSVKTIEFKNGTKFDFASSDIVVFVGPNNAGKSASLKEIFRLIQAVDSTTKIVKDIILEKTGNEDDVTRRLQTVGKTTVSGDGSFIYHGLRYSVPESHIRNYWSRNNIGPLGPAFVLHLSTESRIAAANSPSNINLMTQNPEHPIHFLQRDADLEEEFSGLFRKAFGQDLLIHRNAGGVVPLYTGKRPVLEPGEDRISPSYIQKIEALDSLEQQGDGMRSFLGVLLNATIGSHQILFIDEPEAFLHPPQARLLGQMLSKKVPQSKQLFLATHSEDFLKGLLEADHTNLKVIRIQRDGSSNSVTLLDNQDIAKLWKDSLLRHSNVLSGLFHSKVVVCESDSDARFFSAVLSALYESREEMVPDTLFIPCGGKHRIPVVVKALRKLNVDIKVVVDFDILNDRNPLEEIFTDLGGIWNQIEKDWREVKQSIDQKRPELETSALKEEVEKLFATITERIVPKDKIAEIDKLLRKASAWSEAKRIGKAYVPNGQQTQAYERLALACRNAGLFIVEEGELESFVRSVGSHGPKWVNEVLGKDLANDPDLSTARAFMEAVAK